MPANDDIRDLMGRYAAGSLSDAERRRLFDAALEDQDLFDQLSREHSLKQLIDAPGVRNRLLASLTPPQPAPSLWLKNLIWGLAVMFVIGVSLSAVMIMRNSARHGSQNIGELAKLEVPAASPGAPASAISPPSPIPNPAEPPNGARKPVNPEAKTKRASQPPRAFTAVDAFTDKVQPSTSDRKETDSPAKKESARPKEIVEAHGIGTTPAAVPPPLQPQGFVSTAAPPPVRPQGFAPQASPPPPIPETATGALGGGGGARAGTVGGLSTAAPALGNGRTDTGRFQTQQSQISSQTEQSRNQAPNPAQNQIQSQSPNQSPNQVQSQAQNQRQTQAEAQRLSDKKDAPPPAALARARIAPPFSLQYAVEDQDVVFKFSSDGYLSLHFTPGQDTIVDSRVTAGATRRERMPNNTTEIYITFSAKPQSTTGGINVATRNRADTLTDPDRTRIELMIRLY